MRFPFVQPLIFVCIAQAMFLGVASATEPKQTNHNYLRSPNLEIDEETVAALNAKEHPRELGGCVPSFYADGQCDMSNCSADCTWDGGDCKELQCNGYSSSGGEGGGNVSPSSGGGGGDTASNPPSDDYGYDTTAASATPSVDDYGYDTTAASATPSVDEAACINAGGDPAAIDDGKCNKKNNIPACNHDGKDCEFKFPSKQASPPEDTTTQATAPPSGGGSGSKSQYWTDLHNEVRKHYHDKYGFSYVNLVWSNVLEQSAQSYADVLASSPCEQYDHDQSNPYGENLAVMWEDNKPNGENTRIKRVMDAWTYDEEIKNTNLPWQEGSGHWSQAIWRATHYVGCAHTYRTSESCHVYVCRYLTPGNCARKDNGWLADLMQETSRCEPQCPPGEGCYWSQS